MSVLVEVRQAKKRRRVVPTAPVGRMVQPDRPGRPCGVRPPVVAGQSRDAAAEAPPADVELGFRLTDRGLAMALGLAVVLMVAALVCIGSTALRVMAEPVAATTSGILAE